MKKTLLLLSAALSFLGSYAQTNYTMTYVANAGGNPGGLNTANDDDVTGWNTIISASISANQWSTTVALPFAFNYFGNPVTNFKASANGLLTFNTATGILPNENNALPSTSLPDSTISCFWDAFTTSPPTSSNDYVAWQVFGTAPNRQLWVKWASYEIGAPAANNASFMCMLEETTNKIYLVEGYYAVSASTLAATTTTGIQLNTSTALMYGTYTRNRNANIQAPSDNNVLTFTPYVKSAMTFASATSTQPLQNNIPKSSINEGILRVDIDMSGELSPVNLTQLVFTTSGTTAAADISNAKVFYTGSDSNYLPTSQFGSTSISPSGTFTVTGSQALKMGKNYFWLAYSISSTATLNNLIDAGCNSLTIAGTPQTLTINAPAGSRTIKAGLSGTVNIGTGNTYVYLSDAFKAINANGLSGNTILSITSDIDDTAVASLTYNSGNNYTLKIVPSADIVRNITARFPTTAIEFSNSKYVTIDGKGPVSGTGKYLRFINKDSTGSTFNIINGSRYDTIRNTTIEGAINSQTKGMIHFGTSSLVSTGVRDIRIENNDMRDRSDSTSIPTIMIYSAGTTDLTNSDLTIINNNFFNFRRSGIYVATGNVNGGNFTISNNHFYYNASTAPAGGDVVPIMFIPGPVSDNNTITTNYIGGQAPFCGGSAWLAPNGVNWVAMNINAGLITGTSIQGNTIQNINMTGTAALDFVGIRLETGRMDIGNITGNLIGHPTTPNSIINNMRLTLAIYSLYGAGSFTIGNNTIANITGTGTATTGGVRGICLQAGGPLPTIYNNTIYNLNTACAQTTATTSALMGIGLNSSSEVGPITIKNNKIYNLTASNTTANIVPSGIIVDNATSNGIIEGNIIYGINTPSTGATASIHGLYIQSGTKNWMIRNNMISLTNGANTNAIVIRGISDNNATNTNNYINNTVYIGGTAASGTYNSFAFERRLASVMTVRNNIFYNERSGGTGIHAAIGNVVATPTTSWTNTSSNYNLLIAKTSSSIGLWSSSFTTQTFAQWQVTSTGDVSSWSDTSANIPSASFFKNVANGDLTIDSSNALCWYANGKGIAITGNTNDIHGQTRSSAITTGSVDIGADEFPTTTLPPFATVTGNLATADSSVFTFAGRTVAKIYWNFGIPPTAISLRYYTGVNPPSPGVGKNYFNSYYKFTPTGGTGYNADVKLYYDSAFFKTVPNAASIITGSLATNLWINDPSTVLNTTEQSFRSNGVTSLNVFTGTDVLNPLPTQLVKFVAQITDQKDVLVYWNTASEIQVDHFEIEVSTNNTEFETAGNVKAIGNTNTVSNYSFNDEKAFDIHNSAKLYYRLKMVDEDGLFTYSKIVLVTKDEKDESTVELYPNPYTSSTQLVITSTNEQKGSVLVTDVQGNSISTMNITLQKGINSIASEHLATLPCGLYFIKVSVEDKTYNLKLVK